jgi:hypothetical protein
VHTGAADANGGACADRLDAQASRSNGRTYALQSAVSGGRAHWGLNLQLGLGRERTGSKPARTAAAIAAPLEM